MESNKRNKHRSVQIALQNKVQGRINEAGIAEEVFVEKAMVEKAIKGRGAINNLVNRFEDKRVVADAETMESDRYAEDIIFKSTATEVTADYAKSIITKNTSPDIPFDQSINPYQGCEHGCIYCFARPTHSFWDLSPGLDFERKLRYKANAAELLDKALSNPRYRCRPIALGANTDPYQPIDAKYQVTREILQVLLKHKHPVGIVTKGVLIERDLDLLKQLAALQLCSVRVSVTTLDEELRANMEPRAPTPKARLATIKRLKDAGIPVGVMVAPMIPSINDHELESILETCRTAGAQTAGYVFLRLPHEIKELFDDWLRVHYPGRRQHVLNLIKSSRGGALYQSQFGERMRGSGVYAELLQQRFEKACRRFGYNDQRSKLRTDLFRANPNNYQLSLFE